MSGDKNTQKVQGTKHDEGEERTTGGGVFTPADKPNSLGGMSDSRRVSIASAVYILGLSLGIVGGTPGIFRIVPAWLAAILPPGAVLMVLLGLFVAPKLDAAKEKEWHGLVVLPILVVAAALLAYVTR